MCYTYKGRTYLFLLVVDHDVVRFYIPVHYALAVTEIQRLEQLKDVVADIVVHKLGIQASEIGIVDIFEYKRGRLALGAHVSYESIRDEGARRCGLYPVAHPTFSYLIVSNDIQQRNNVWAARQILQNLDLALDLLLLDRLQDLDDAFLIVDNVDAFKHLRVLAAAWKLESDMPKAWVSGGQMHTDLADDLVVLQHAP